MKKSAKTWSPEMMTEMKLDAVAVLRHNAYSPLAMRVWTDDDTAEDDGLVCFVDTARVDLDAFMSIYHIAHDNQFAIIEIEYDKLDTHDPDRPRIDCIWIKMDDLETFRVAFANRRLNPDDTHILQEHLDAEWIDKMRKAKADGSPEWVPELDAIAESYGLPGMFDTPRSKPN